MSKDEKQEGLFELPPDLADELEVLRAKREQTKEVNKLMGPGPVYQGVSKTIRRLSAKGAYKHLDPVVDEVEFAGTIAAARAVARAIDKATGHNVTGWVASGRDLSPMLEELRELMAILNPDSSVDAFTEWLNDDDAPREESAHARAAQAPHPEV